MNLNKLGLALLAILALSAVAANSTMAAASTGTTSWYKEEVKVTEGQANGLPVSCTQNGELTFNTTVSGAPLKVKATGTECVGSVIYNLTNEGAMALFSGELKFTGVSVVEPAGCSTTSSIMTKPLSGQLYMDGEHSDLRIIPTAGEAAGIMSFEVAGTGCPLATTVVPKGSVFGQEEKLTGESAVEQKLSFSKAINEGAGGTLHVGSEAATITGNVGISLAAPNSGKKFESK